MRTSQLKRDAKKVLHALKCAKRIYTFGNGGSAAIANHMACDWMKLSDGYFNVTSLTANTSLLTAIGNDLGYNEVLSAQVRWQITPLDLLVLVSSSGNSLNIQHGVAAAIELGAKVLGFTGFDGGFLRYHADISVHIDTVDYGVAEDYHSNVMHEVARLITKEKKK